MSWCDGHLTTILGAVCQASLLTVTAEDPPKSRSGTFLTQDYTEFPNYVPELTWRQLQDHPESAIDTLTRFLIRLGLRCPSEHTAQKVAAVYLLCTVGQQNIGAMSQANRFANNEMLKRRIRGGWKREDRSSVNLVKALPRDPEEFKHVHEELFRRALEDQEPGTCPFADVMLDQVTQQIPMRSTKKTDMMQLQVGPRSALSSSEVMQFSQALSGMMREMQQAQEANMQQQMTFQAQMKQVLSDRPPNGQLQLTDDGGAAGDNLSGLMPLADAYRGTGRTTPPQLLALPPPIHVPDSVDAAFGQFCTKHDACIK